MLNLFFYQRFEPETVPDWFILNRNKKQMFFLQSQVASGAGRKNNRTINPNFRKSNHE